MYLGLLNFANHPKLTVLDLISGPCKWAAFVNTNVAGGLAHRSQTLADCQRSCINTLYCVGIDIDPSPRAIFCWLTVLPDADGPMQPFNGVTHYILTRNVGCPFVGEFSNIYGIFIRQMI